MKTKVLVQNGFDTNDQILSEHKHINSTMSDSKKLDELKRDMNEIIDVVFIIFLINRKN